ncbi:hypothetical protein UP09_22565 [Bradyrhizobium sp. LTSP885]|nr:hypothetical protein UP09_22565 [Bradyrhizobium sp. LTSP885]
MSHTAMVSPMPIYCFSIHNADGSDYEFGGRMALTNDNAARAFGKAMIRDLMRGDPPRYAGWTMDVAKGTRPVCSIPFPPERIPSAALG